MRIAALSLCLTAFMGQAPTSSISGNSGISRSGGLGGLRPPDNRALAFEAEVLAAINAKRQALHHEPVAMDERLRQFARAQATQASTGATSVDGAEAAVKAQNLAPFGHRMQFVAAPTAAATVAQLFKDSPALFHSDFAHAGVGAFYVPAKPAYFQMLVVLTQEVDPMLGKSGLSSNQTDPVMQAAQPALLACYNAALRHNPALRGNILLQIGIDGDGHVAAVHVMQSLQARDLDACLVDTVRGLSFPQPYKQKPVTLLHPMRLAPSATADPAVSK